MMTVNKCFDRGIYSFGAVHDSYGTVAGDVSAMRDTLRECFVDMYAEDRLAHFREGVEKRLSVKGRSKLEPTPAQGDLDLSKVLESDYFFA
jgi:DNA-directed RNA polymerase